MVVLLSTFEFVRSRSRGKAHRIRAKIYTQRDLPWVVRAHKRAEKARLHAVEEAS
jgi:hypothetical protein